MKATLSATLLSAKDLVSRNLTFDLVCFENPQEAANLCAFSDQASATNARRTTSQIEAMSGFLLRYSGIKLKVITDTNGTALVIDDVATTLATQQPTKSGTVGSWVLRIGSTPTTAVDCIFGGLVGTGHPLVLEGGNSVVAGTKKRIESFGILIGKEI